MGFLLKAQSVRKATIKVPCVFLRLHGASFLKHRLTLNILEVFAGKFRLVQLGDHVTCLWYFSTFSARQTTVATQKILSAFIPEGWKSQSKLSS